MEKHQFIATLIFFVLVIILWVRDGMEAAVEKGLLLFILLLPIYFYRHFAYFAGFGFMEYFARDFGEKNHPGAYAILFWLLFIVAGLFLLFEWKVY